MRRLFWACQSKSVSNHHKADVILRAAVDAIAVGIDRQVERADIGRRDGGQDDRAALAFPAIDAADAVDAAETLDQVAGKRAERRQAAALSALLALQLDDRDSRTTVIPVSDR